MEKVGKEELHLILQSFQKDKIPGPDGLPMEFFLGCYEFVEEDLRRVIEVSRTSDKILATFNTTFIASIPKANNPTSFDNFHSISFCNCIYKIISKIIARRLKGILSRHISAE
jgi:hypothetical protein